MQVGVDVHTNTNELFPLIATVCLQLLSLHNNLIDLQCRQKEKAFSVFAVGTTQIINQDLVTENPWTCGGEGFKFVWAQLGE